MGSGREYTVEERKIQLLEKLDPTAPGVLLGRSIQRLVSNLRSLTADWKFIDHSAS